MGKREQKYNREQIRKGNLTQEQVDYLIEDGVRLFQEEQQLTVDGMAGPKTQEALGLLDGDKELKHFPEGKGVYIRSLKDTGHPEAAAKKAESAGLDFVVIGSVWISRKWYLGGAVKVTKMNSVVEIENYSKAFRNRGIKVWLWGYPYPGREQEFERIVADHLIAAQAKGFIVDPEKPYRNNPDAAEKLMTLLTRLCDDLGVGIGFTSYAATWFFKDFPYAVFASFAKVFGSPQVYDNKNNMPDTYAHRAYDSYKEFGFNPIIVSTPGYKKTRRQWRKLVESHPVESKGIIVWDWKNLNNNPHLWDELTQYTV